MISTSITGGEASNQLFDLLALVSNPEAYKAKLDELSKATAEYKTYVEAIGPASEIVKLREQAQALREEAARYTAEAIALADAKIKDANEKADQILADASRVASAKIAESEKQLEMANTKDKQLQQALEDAAKAKQESESAINGALAAQKAAEEMQALAEEAKADAETTKSDILAKHKAFIESL